MKTEETPMEPLDEREALGLVDRKLRRQQVELRAVLRTHGETLHQHLKGDLYAALDTVGTARARIAKLTAREEER